jgi:hypothetical protein
MIGPLLVCISVALVMACVAIFGDGQGQWFLGRLITLPPARPLKHWAKWLAIGIFVVGYSAWFTVYTPEGSIIANWVPGWVWIWGGMIAAMKAYSVFLDWREVARYRHDARVADRAEWAAARDEDALLDGPMNPMTLKETNDAAELKEIIRRDIIRARTALDGSKDGQSWGGPGGKP